MPTRNQRDFLQVGQFAAEFGINPKTIRYYEQIGLLPTARRTSAGYRLYGPKDADHLRFILKARGIGLTLNEIRDILNLRQNGKQPCEQERVDVVQIFRKPEDVPPIVEEAIAIGAKAVWMQPDIIHEEAAARARAAGLRVVMDRCLRATHREWEASRKR